MAKGPKYKSLAAALFDAAVKLRAAQVEYLANRGNDEYGKKVGEAAAVVDAAIAEYTLQVGKKAASNEAQ